MVLSPPHTAFSENLTLPPHPSIWFFSSSSSSLDCFLFFSYCFVVGFLPLFCTLICTFLYSPFIAHSFFLFTNLFFFYIDWLTITVWEMTGNIQQSSKWHKTSESLSSETWRIPAFPFIFVAKQVVSIFRNQQEISSLYILDSTDLTKHANNDIKNGKANKQTILGETLSKESRFYTLDTEAQLMNTGIYGLKDHTSKALEIRNGNFLLTLLQIQI